ncbi:MAG TPA: hypothetical protein PK975_13970 [Candidatus Hydrogenedentes bacterium]|nr:hypothetical protein [Candidatus Hydrogenedentota bacterium]HPO86983.1 hypothetical protein [Candidatus Hydrogenedentota bacterium]
MCHVLTSFHLLRTKEDPVLLPGVVPKGREPKDDVEFIVVVDGPDNEGSVPADGFGVSTLMGERDESAMGVALGRLGGDRMGNGAEISLWLR